jgi:hypothetical protein
MIQLDENFDLQAVRERLRRMDDAALLRWGQAAARLSSQREIFRLQDGAQMDEPSEDVWVAAQLREGRDRRMMGAEIS